MCPHDSVVCRFKPVVSRPELCVSCALGQGPWSLQYPWTPFFWLPHGLASTTVAYLSTFDLCMAIILIPTSVNVDIHHFSSSLQSRVLKRVRTRAKKITKILRKKESKRKELSEISTIRNPASRFHCMTHILLLAKRDRAHG